MRQRFLFPFCLCFLLACGGGAGGENTEVNKTKKLGEVCETGECVDGFACVKGTCVPACDTVSDCEHPQCCVVADTKEGGGCFGRSEAVTSNALYTCP